MEFMTAIIVLVLLATMVVLGWGVGSMVHGGHYDEEHGTQLMGARVGFQLLAIVLILIAAVISG